MRNHQTRPAFRVIQFKEDPSETTNLADKYPEMVQEFDQAMQKMHVPSPYWPQPGETF